MGIAAREAAGDRYRTRRTVCAALPMPALRRSHDCHRSLRARLRAKVAAGPLKFAFAFLLLSRLATLS
jgi:hypothetical protein